MTKKEQKLIEKVMAVLVQSRHGYKFMSYTVNKQNKILYKIMKDAVNIVSDVNRQQAIIKKAVKCIKLLNKEN